MSALGRLLGAGDGDRTHLTSLGSSGNNHYTTPARTLNFTEGLDEFALKIFLFFFNVCLRPIAVINAAVTFLDNLQFAPKSIASTVNIDIKPYTLKEVIC